MEAAAPTAASDVRKAVGGGGGPELGPGPSLPMRTRPWDEPRRPSPPQTRRRGTAAREWRAERMRRLEGGVLLPLTHFCHAVRWPGSPFASAEAAGATVDMHASSGTPLVPLGPDLSVPNYDTLDENRSPVLYGTETHVCVTE